MPEDGDTRNRGEALNDPFEEVEDPALHYVIDRWGKLRHTQSIIIEGHVTALTMQWELKRSGTGGSAGSYDTVQGYAKLEPTNLKCDIVIRKPIPSIVEAGGDLAVLGEVARRFGRELDLATYDILVQHNETIYTLRDGKPQRVVLGKGVKIATKSAAVETEVL